MFIHPISPVCLESLNFCIIFQSQSPLVHDFLPDPMTPAETNRPNLCVNSCRNIECINKEFLFLFTKQNQTDV